MDHMAFCFGRNEQPHTPGKEGLQDEDDRAICESAGSNRSVKLNPRMSSTRGPEPEDS
jgi:hypothetical protein